MRKITSHKVGTNGITQEALTHLEDAMHWLQHRTRERVARGVEGTNQK